MELLNQRGRYHAVYANLEIAQPARENIERGVKAICSALAGAAERYPGEPRLDQWISKLWSTRGPEAALSALLQCWSEASKRPLVLMLDEAEPITGGSAFNINAPAAPQNAAPQDGRFRSFAPEPAHHCGYHAAFVVNID